MIGQTISHYRILEKLGEGGMGVVYKAQDTKLDRIVALKFLPSDLTQDPEAKERFVHEARAASALNHPNICAIHTIEEFEGRQFLDMEFVEGVTLRERNAQCIAKSLFAVQDVIQYAIQIGEGLNAAHKKGIIHRDIKPDNIMLTDEGQVKIMDFGLAKVKGATKLTKAGSTLGTAAYMSPEQVRGEEVDQRSDIFSFGVVLYELLTSKLPFIGEHHAAVMYSIINEEPQPIARFNERVSPELQHIVSKALAKDKEERYQHVDDLIADLRHERKKIEYAKTGNISKTVSAITETKKLKYKRTISIIAGIVVLIILAIIFNPFKQLKDQPPVAGTDKKSIAVLPFVDMSPQKDQEYFCDGMTEALINRLSNVNKLRVPARTSAFYFKGKTENIQEIGGKLKVQTVLEGSVQKSGDRLRVTAQLINVADGYHLWSEKFDRELKDVFAIQDEIATAIVNALMLELTPREIEKISERPIDNIKAYEYYLKAGHLVMRFDEKSLDSASAYLQTAIDIIGDNALLYSAMASVHSQYTNIGIRQEDYLNKSREYVKKALALKPDCAGALAQLGWLAMYDEYPRNIQDSYRYYKKALAADSNDTRAISGIMNTYDQIGQPSKVYALLEKFVSVDPLNPHRYIRRGYNSLYDCKFGPALEQFRLLYQTDPASPIAQTSYSYSLAYNGKRDEAISVVDGIKNADMKNAITVYCFLLKYALLKDKERALRLITPDFRKTCWRDYEWSYWVGNILSLAGIKKESMDWIENAINRGFINYPFMKCDPFLANVRGEERFKKLMEKARYEWEHFEEPE